ncbi:hypothetical protein [Pseudooceanicola sp. LIPI14-2-Ac024]|uniref:hypothetical protein n=1 Tax=Pseudooceanicola sp. LIPI14-2-Ac024 TaxID=3344875 RepID=UPI0035D10F8D
MAHFTVAASERTFQELFTFVRDNVAESTSGSADAGPFSVAWAAGFRLEGGSVDLQADGTVRIDELDVVYDPLSLTLGIDIPRICIGGFCIIWIPFAGCVLRAPRICIFEADPDISIPLNLSGLVTSEISGAFRINTRYFVDPMRTPGMTDLDAEDAGVPNKWQFMLDPVWLDIDLIDISDTVGNILDAAIDTAVDGLLGFLPGWARDLIKAILGPIVDLVRAILDIVDDIDEWLSNLLGVSIGLFDFVLTVVADYLANLFPLFEFEDPYPILGYNGPLIPVKVPMRDVAVGIDTDEMTITANVGA